MRYQKDISDFERVKHLEKSSEIKDFHRVEIKSNNTIIYGHDLPGFRCIFTENKFHHNEKNKFLNF